MDLSQLLKILEIGLLAWVWLTVVTKIVVGAILDSFLERAAKFTGWIISHNKAKDGFTLNKFQ